ncbi:MAG: hypothetical protein U1E53_20415 [Dongiaceae bacterium]
MKETPIGSITSCQGPEAGAQQVPRQPVEVGKGEVRVLEPREQQQVGADRRRKPQAAPPAGAARHRGDEDEVQQRRGDRDPDEDRLAPGVEQQAGAENDEIDRAPRGERVHGQEQRQEAEQEERRCEQHGTRPVPPAGEMSPAG